MLSANEMEIIRQQAYCCKPHNYRNICKVYPWKVEDMVEMGTNVYYSRLDMLLSTEATIVKDIKKNTGKDVSVDSIHPLEYLLQSATINDMVFLELMNAFSTFTKEEVLLLPKINSVLIGGKAAMAERRLITESNFQDFQNILRIQNCLDVAEPPPENETPTQRKMRLLHEQVAAVKKKQSQKSGEGQTFSELLEIAGTFGIDTEKSLYAFRKLLRRHQMREKWDNDLEMLCAGADGQKLKTKYWGESPDD